MSDAEVRKSKAFLKDAYSLESAADTLAFYDRWAEEYDVQLERGLRYVAPALLTEALARHQPECCASCVQTPISYAPCTTRSGTARLRGIISSNLL